MDLILQPIAPSITVDQVVHRPPGAIQEWICSSILHIQQYLSAAQQHACLHTQDVHSFLVSHNH